MKSTPYWYAAFAPRARHKFTIVTCPIIHFALSAHSFIPVHSFWKEMKKKSTHEAWSRTSLIMWHAPPVTPYQRLITLGKRHVICLMFIPKPIDTNKGSKPHHILLVSIRITVHYVRKDDPSQAERRFKFSVLEYDSHVVSYFFDGLQIWLRKLFYIYADFIASFTDVLLWRWMY